VQVSWGICTRALSLAPQRAPASESKRLEEPGNPAKLHGALAQEIDKSKRAYLGTPVNSIFLTQYSIEQKQLSQKWPHTSSPVHLEESVSN
jgi:hypothetical protein